MAQTRVNSQDIRDQQVKTADIMDDAVTTVKILDANVTNQKLDLTGVGAGTYRAPLVVVNAQGRITSASEILTTKGDLLTFTTAVTRLGVGGDGSVLSADSTQASGLKWLTQSATSPLSYNSSTGVFSLGGLVSIGGANQILGVNAAGTSWEYKTLNGTTNQVDIVHASNSVTFGLPQDIATSSSPSFSGITLSGLTANRLVSTTTGGTLQVNSALTTNGFVYSNGSGSLSSTAAATNGQLLIGSTGVAPVSATLSGTTDRITVTNGAGSITLNISSLYAGQSSIATVGTITSGTWNGSVVGPAYGGTGLSSYVLGDTLYASAANVLSVLSGNTTTTKMFLRQTGTGSVSAAPAWDTLVAGDIPNLDASKITTGVFPIARGGTNSGTSLNNNRIMISSGGAIVEHSALTTGSVIFANSLGLPGQDNSNFFWDDTNNRLGILTASPTSTLSIGSSSQFQVSSIGDLVKVNNITYAWPSAQGSSNNVLMNDGSGNLSWSPVSSLSMYREVFEDYLVDSITDHSAMGSRTETANGGTAVVDVSAADNTYSGAVNVSTGTTNNSTGRAALTTSSGVNLIKAGGGKQTLEWRIRMPVLSTSSPRYIVRAGLQSSSAVGNPPNGIYFYYTDNINSGNWRGVTRDSSTSTDVDSSVSVVANTWYKLRVEVNAAGNNVDFFVNDVLIGSSTSNIPTTNAMRLMVKVEKGSTSTTSRTVNIDWFYYRIER